MELSELDSILKNARLVRHKNAASRRSSAICLIKALLVAEGVIPAHRREYLGRFIYKITEAEFTNKKSLKYRSLASLATSGKNLCHEHVFRRKFIVSDLLERPAAVEDILQRAVACIVTKTEHDLLTKLDKLHPNLDGWERYRKAEIAVIDMDSRAILELPVV